MGKQLKVFDLLTKKQSLTVFKSQKKKSKLSEELNEIISYQKKLNEILKSISITKRQKTVAEIKSENLSTVSPLSFCQYYTLFPKSIHLYL